MDELLGKRFGPDNQLEVIGTSEKVKGKPLRYEVRCAICAEDPDMHGDAIYMITKGDLKRGKLPCGCSKSMRYSRPQLELKIKRECYKRGFEFNGFSENFEKSLIKSKIKLKCQNGHSWSSTTADSFLQGCGCPECRNAKIAESKRKSDEDLIATFVATGAFVDGTRFERNEVDSVNRVQYWNVHCPRCSHDEYVQANLCSGIFSSSTGSLQRGSQPCRCSKNYKWSLAQREYQISKLLEGTNVTFKFEDTSGSKKSNVVCSCPEHGEWHATIDSLVNQKSGCPKCAKYGYNEARDGFIYVLLVQGKESFTGYGITSDVETRIATHVRHLRQQGFQIFKSFISPMYGTTALELERKIKNRFSVFPQSVAGFKTEATAAENYNDVVAFVRTETSKKIKNLLELANTLETADEVMGTVH